MTRTTTPPDSQRPAELRDAAAAQLEGILRDLISRYERLEALADLRASAIARADTRSLAGCIAEENTLVQEVADIEKRRVEVVGGVAKRLGSPEKTSTPLSWIAERLGGAAGERLGRLAGTLRALLQAVVRKNDACRAAADMLAGHLDGLVRSVTASLNHAKTYGRAGVVTGGARVVSAIDVTS